MPRPEFTEGAEERIREIVREELGGAGGRIYMVGELGRDFFMPPRDKAEDYLRRRFIALGGGEGEGADFHASEVARG